MSRWIPLSRRRSYSDPPRYHPSGIKSAGTRLAANRDSPTVVQAMRPRWGKANGGGAMSKNDQPAGEQKIEISYEVPLSPEGAVR
jgi:hypothetical protein